MEIYRWWWQGTKRRGAEAAVQEQNDKEWEKVAFFGGECVCGPRKTRACRLFVWGFANEGGMSAVFVFLCIFCESLQSKSVAVWLGAGEIDILFWFL
jgi:hypothetical protein